MAPKHAAPKAQAKQAKGSLEMAVVPAKKATGLALVIGEAGEKMGKAVADAVRYQLVKLEREGKGHVRQAYKALGSGKERKGFALRLSLDAEGSWLSLEESSSAKVINKKMLKKGWWGLWEVAKEEGINWNPKDEECVSLVSAMVSECESRPHENKKLADLGHKQFYWCKAEKDSVEALKQRKIEGKKRQDEVSHEEFEMALDMIDAEPPCSAVGGRIPKKKLSEADRKEAAEKRRKKEEEEWSKLSSKERQAKTEKKARDDYNKRLKAIEKLLSTDISKGAQLEGRLSSIKGSKYLNPAKVKLAVKEQLATIKMGMEKLQKTAVFALEVSASALSSKKLTQAITDGEHIHQKWTGFLAEVGKHLDA